MEWISVDKDLPQVSQNAESEPWRVDSEESNDVLCYAPVDYIGICKGRYSHKANKWILDGMWAPKPLTITHWMPLPEPPKSNSPSPAAENP